MTVKLLERIISANQVCQSCGLKYGAGISKNKSQRSLSAWTIGVACDICEELKDVTQFRDFGYARDEFYNEKI